MPRLVAVFLLSIITIIPGAATEQRGVFWSQNQTVATSGSTPTFVAAASYTEAAAQSVSTASSTCPTGHSRVFVASDYSTGDTLGLTTTGTATITSRVAYAGVINTNSNSYSQVWTAACNGSSGTFTLTSSIAYYAQLVDIEISGGAFDAASSSANDPLTSGNYNYSSPSITAAGADLILAVNVNTYSSTPPSTATGWTNQLDVSQAAAWSQVSSAGSVSAPSGLGAGGYGLSTVIVGYHP